jgi:hypothetical protein
MKVRKWFCFSSGTAPAAGQLVSVRAGTASHEYVAATASPAGCCLSQTQTFLIRSTTLPALADETIE